MEIHQAPNHHFRTSAPNISATGRAWHPDGHARRVRKVNAGEFDQMSTEQLREFIAKEVATLGLDKPPRPMIGDGSKH
jgi:hypothetical protein